MTADQAKRAKREKAVTLYREDYDDQNDHGNSPARRESGDAQTEQRDHEQSRTSKGLGIALGIFSIGLGLTEVLVPRKFARTLGVRPSPYSSTAIRLFGLREIVSGVGMVLQPEREEWAWSRVGGDLLDISALIRARQNSRNQSGRLAAMTGLLVGVTALDVARAQQLRPRRKRREAEQTAQRERDALIEVRRSVTVNRPVAEVYEYWRNLENLPQFMQHLEAVSVTDDQHSEWTAKAPAGMTVSWTAEIVEDQADRLIAWRSVEGSQVENSGSVRFETAPGDRGTEVHVTLSYNPPGGRVGAIVAKLFGEEPTLQVADDLRRLKQVLETGEVLVSDASLHRGMHPAQPSTDKPANPPFEAEQQLLVARSADASEQSSNNERQSTQEPRRDDEWYNNELANERSTF